MSLKPGSKIYFMGIGGTGMAPVAGLMQQAGYDVSGSDSNLYPPMSTMLEELGIPVIGQYSPQNLATINPDLVVVANALSRGHDELEAMLQTQIPYTSFPKLLADTVLSKLSPIVITGTHGKTTTTSLIAHVLTELGEDPGFLIGGLPKNFPRSFQLGSGKLFVIEGDEYDTAYFDKGPKFLHYCPKHLLLNNLEFDHADIYSDLAAIETQFTKLIQLPKDPQHIVVNCDDHSLIKLIRNADMEKSCLRVSTTGRTPNADIVLLDASVDVRAVSRSHWRSELSTKYFGALSLTTKLAGRHNASNIALAVGIIQSLILAGELSDEIKAGDIQDAVSSFEGVRRRLEHLGSVGGVDVYEDFAHHPTAMGLVIDSLRKMHPERKLVVCFEPRNASSRRNIFQDEFGEVLAMADRALIGQCPVDLRIPASQRMDTKALERSIGASATSFATNEDLLDELAKETSSGDLIVFMSCGSFSGVQHQLLSSLKNRPLIVENRMAEKSLKS